MFNKILILALSIICLTFVSCSKDGDSDIEAYIKKKNLTAQVTDEGLYFIIDVPGNLSKVPKINSDVKVAYVGTLLDDKEFDANENFTTNLSNVIAGWRRGIPLFGEGGKGTIIVPPSLGYGSSAVGSIPANSALVFKIELKEVIN